MQESIQNHRSIQALLVEAEHRLPSLLDLIQQLVEAESPSNDKAAVDRCMAIAAALASKLGGRVTVHPQQDFGDVLEIRFGATQARRERILLLGHLDTVWPVGTLETMPYQLRDGRLHGPGTLDMKAGVAMALTAIEMLCASNLLHREIVLLLNSEEEIGSPISRPITERLAADSAAVFVLEAAQGLALKTARKGIGNWRMDVQGKAAHAGVDFEKGASAILELARVIETVSGWTDLERGLTVSVGVIGGGSKSNVIAAEAWAEVDVRFLQKADAIEIERKFSQLKASNPGCTLRVTGGINRPPMERTAATVRLFEQAKKLAAALGFSLNEAATGGASDGNFTAALGIPTLDGMGAVGEGAHAAHESVVLSHLASRTALLVGMLAYAPLQASDPTRT